jgi:hypothetical protein
MDGVEDLHEITVVWLHGIWSSCTVCGKDAWAHSNADVVGDISAWMSWQRAGGRSRPPAPKTKGFSGG